MDDAVRAFKNSFNLPILRPLVLMLADLVRFGLYLFLKIPVETWKRAGSSVGSPRVFMSVLLCGKDRENGCIQVVIVPYGAI
jgi:hypothetical protein